MAAVLPLPTPTLLLEDVGCGRVVHVEQEGERERERAGKEGGGMIVAPRRETIESLEV